jgi:hypothetical protein
MLGCLGDMDISSALAGIIHDGTATKSGLRNPPNKNICIGLPCGLSVEQINADSTSQRKKTITGWKKSSVAWGVGVSQFP